MALPKGVCEEEIAAEGFMSLHKDELETYVELRAMGFHPQTAWKRSFITKPDCDWSIALDTIEGQPWFQSRLAARIKAMKVSEMWDLKASIHEMLGIVRDIFAKDATRLNAIKELNVLVGITYTDETGKSKAGRGLADFYRDNGEIPPRHAIAAEAEQTPSVRDATRH